MLDEPRRPWLDPEALKEKFHALSAEHHPDVAKDSRIDFAQLNTAYQILRDPITRVRHLLELEFPQALTEHRAIPSDIADLFLRICQTQQAIQNFRTRENQATTPLARALLMSEKLNLREQLEAILVLLDEKQRSCLDELRNLDVGWGQETGTPATILSALHLKLAYLSKWLQQLRDCLFTLA